MSTLHLISATDPDRRKAAEIVARAYSGKVSEADQKMVDDWLAESADNAQKYQDALDIWQLTGDLGEDWLQELDKPQIQSRHRAPVRLWIGYSLVAGLLFAIAVALPELFNAAQVSPDTPVSSTYTTNTGEQKNVELPDGSRVTLNTNTRLVVYFNDDFRRAMLEQGEVFFEVSQDPTRPFVVDTGERSVTVLGTKFDVHKAGFTLQVSVIEGVVAVHTTREQLSPQDNMVELSANTATLATDAKDKYKLKAGVSASFSGGLNGNVETGTVNNPGKYPEWRNGSVRFIDAPLIDVMKELNRYTQKKILIEDSRVMELRLSGVFQLDIVESELHKMEKILPVRVTRYPDRIVITGL